MPFGTPTASLAALQAAPSAFLPAFSTTGQIAPLFTSPTVIHAVTKPPTVTTFHAPSHQSSSTLPFPVSTPPPVASSLSAPVHLTAGAHSPAAPSPGISFSPLTTPPPHNKDRVLGFYLHEATKSALASFSFIDDLRELLPKDANHPREDKRPGPISWQDWIQAWNVLQALTVGYRADPSLAPKLGKHFETVLEIQRANGDWRNYDADFRRSVSQGSDSWGTPNVESKLRCLSTKSDFSRPLFTPKKSGPTPNLTPPSSVGELTREHLIYPYCFKFHMGEVCGNSNCTYVHMCPNCANGQTHPVKKCPKKLHWPFRPVPRDRSNSSAQGRASKPE